MSNKNFVKDVVLDLIKDQGIIPAMRATRVVYEGSLEDLIKAVASEDKDKTFEAAKVFTLALSAVFAMDDLLKGEKEEKEEKEEKKEEKEPIFVDRGAQA